MHVTMSHSTRTTVTEDAVPALPDGTTVMDAAPTPAVDASLPDGMVAEAAARCSSTPLRPPNASRLSTPAADVADIVVASANNAGKKIMPQARPNRRALVMLSACPGSNWS